MRIAVQTHAVLWLLEIDGEPRSRPFGNSLRFLGLRGGRVDIPGGYQTLACVVSKLFLDPPHRAFRPGCPVGTGDLGGVYTESRDRCEIQPRTISIQVVEEGLAEALGRRCRGRCLERS